MTSGRSVPLSVIVLVAIAAALITGAVIEIGPRSSSARTETQVITAERGVVQSTVTGTGNVEPSVDDTVNFKMSGTLQDVFVHVGQHVREGELMATLDPSAAKLALAQAKENLTAAEDQLSSAESAQQTSTTPTTSTTTTTTPATSPTSSGRSGLTAATRQGQGAGRFGRGATGATGTPATSTPTEVVTRTVTVTTPSQSAVQSSAASVAQAKASVDSAQAAVTNAQQQLDDTNLYAPAGGTIVSMATVSTGDAITAGGTGNSNASGSGGSNSGSNSGSGAAGGLGSLLGSNASNASSGSNSSSSSSSFAEIVDSSHLTMTVPFSESDVTKIKVGQPATVTLDAIAGVELGAHVTAISTIGTSSSGVVSYDATITLDQNDSRVRPGMSASAAVVIGQAQGVTLPNNAVSGNGSTGLVQLLKNGKPVATPVVVGLRGDSRTQIISGLSAGQQVSVTTTLPALGQSSSLATSSNSGTLGGGRLGGLGGGGRFGAGGFARLLGG